MNRNMFWCKILEECVVKDITASLWNSNIPSVKYENNQVKVPENLFDRPHPPTSRVFFVCALKDIVAGCLKVRNPWNLFFIIEFCDEFLYLRIKVLKLSLTFTLCFDSWSKAHLTFVIARERSMFFFCSFSDKLCVIDSIELKRKRLTRNWNSLIEQLGACDLVLSHLILLLFSKEREGLVLKYL